MFKQVDNVYPVKGLCRDTAKEQMEADAKMILDLLAANFSKDTIVLTEAEYQALKELAGG